jgi:predicted anti-sigma-YlaC factor YlaD
VRCDPFREALSARLDGEPPGLPDREVDRHLAGCAACRDWLQAAAEVTRRARLVLAPAVRDVTAAVLSRLPAVPRPRPRRLDLLLRAALLAVGTGQLGVGLPALLGAGAPPTDLMVAPVHLAHETGAWNVGLAACFLVVAVLPRLAAGALPFLLSFTAVLTWVTVGDLGAGHVTSGRAVAHGFLLVGALLVAAIAVRGGAGRGRPAPGNRSWVARRWVGLRAGGAQTGTGVRSVLRSPAGPPAADVPASAERSAA